MLISQNYGDDFLQYWENSLIRLQLPKARHAEVYTLLSRSYSESQRYYHNQQHIVECLALFHEIKHGLNDALAVETAIWFHDVIYDPQASDNELQSAALMKKICQDFLSSAQLEKVYEWILATQRHQPSAESDLRYLLDIDLAILGSHSDRFAEYEKQIQLEYSWVEPNLYQIKRAEALNHFYQMSPIFQTKIFQDKFEHNSKNNLQFFMQLTEIKAIQSLNNFNAKRLENNQLQREKKRNFENIVQEFFDQIVGYLLTFVLIGTLAGITLIVGIGGLFLIFPFAALIYYYILKKKPQEMRLESGENWLLQAPHTRQYLSQIQDDYDHLRIPLLIYGMYMTELLSLELLEEVSIRLSEDIVGHTFELESLSLEIIELVRVAKVEYALGFNKVADVYFLLLKCQNLNKNIVDDIIQKLFQTFSQHTQNFIQREDLHLKRLLAEYK